MLQLPVSGCVHKARSADRGCQHIIHYGTCVQNWGVFTPPPRGEIPRILPTLHTVQCFTFWLCANDSTNTFGIDSLLRSRNTLDTRQQLAAQLTVTQQEHAGHTATTSSSTDHASVSFLPFLFICCKRQCFDTVGWATGRASGL